LAWSREPALTTLAARPACPRLGDCSFPTHSRACGLLPREADMVVRKEKKIAAEPLRVQNPHAAGIDVHAEVHWVAVPPGAAAAAKSSSQPAAVGACLRYLHRRPGNAGRLVATVRRHHGGHGSHGRLLDRAVRTPGAARLRGLPGRSTPVETCSGPAQDRRAR